MPRGIPKKNNLNNSENNMKKMLDTKNSDVESGLVNSAAMGLIGEKDNSPREDVVDYTMSPDGKYRIPKPKSHGTYVEDSSTRIPYFNLPGHVVAWHIDREPNELSIQVRRGYNFVTPETEGVPEGQELKAYGGVRADGSAYFHYAMYMPIDRFKQLNASKQTTLKDHELGQGIYSTEQMSLKTEYQHGIPRKE